jgi:hypothetical protein
MRTKIIAGNLVAVLAVGLVSYFVVRAELESTLLADLNREIEHDHPLFERSWRLSSLEFVDQAADAARADVTRDIFLALNENDRRGRALRRAGGIADTFARVNRDAGAPEVVVITDANGMVISRNRDPNRMHGDDLKPQLRTLAGVLSAGTPAADVWSFEAGQRKFLQTALAPIRDVNGEILGAVIVGYDMSNGMAERAGAQLGREVAFLTESGVYSSSLDGSVAQALRRTLFSEARQAETRASIAADEAGDRWLVELEGDEWVGITGPLPIASSTRVGYAVLANRSEQADKISPLTTILVLTGVGVLIVLIYGFLIGTSFLKPIAELEEGVLAVINGRTDLRLEIESAELGGLAYRINQLLNVFTGTPEEDEEGRVSSPPEAWGPEAASTAGTDVSAVQGSPGAPATNGGEEDDPDLAAKLAGEAEDAYYERIFNEYVAAKQAAGENVSNITKDRFVQRLQANEKTLIKKHSCRMVRFQVQVKGTQVNLRPVVIR